MKIAIASGKGGTGKTFVSTNLFRAVQKTRGYITLIDSDAEEPNVAEFFSGEVLANVIVSQKIPVIDAEKCVFCGKCHEYCSYHAIVYLPPSHYIRVVEDLCHDCGACSVACKSGAITLKEKQLGTVQSMRIDSHAFVVEGRANVGVFSAVPVIKQALKEAGVNTFVLIDAPPGISCPFITSVYTADFVILVTEPTPFGLNDLKLSVETLRQLGKPFGVVINRSGLGNNDVYDWLHENDILLLMEIPFDREIARIYSEGRILVDEKPQFQDQFAGLLKKIEKQLKR